MQFAPSTVMPVLVTGIHAFYPGTQGVDGRNKSGHDDRGAAAGQTPAPQINRSN